MKYSWFEILVMGVAVCVIVGTSFATFSGAYIAPQVVGQALILLALFGGLHYGRKGAVVGCFSATLLYAAVLFPSMSGEPVIALEMFLLHTAIYGAFAFGAGELNTHLKYLFVRLEHPEYVDGITNLYNARYLSKLLDNKISEFDRYGLNFSLTSFTIDGNLLAPMKKRVRNKLISEIGNSVIRENIRCVDEAARVDGSKFMILFSNTNLEGATIASNRVSGKIRRCLGRHGIDTDREDAVETEVLGYPENREAIEKLASGLSEAASA